MLLKVYTTLRHLSIDIVFGAVILLHFFSLQLNTSLHWSAYILLGNAVWIIYTFDHLNDAQAAKFGDRDRYSFHRKNQTAIKIALTIVAVISSILSYYVPFEILYVGIPMAILGLIYLLFQQALASKGLKELYVGIVYTSGILLPVFFVSEKYEWYFFGIVLLMAYSNLLIFSWFEEDVDQKDAFLSIATLLGSSNVQKLLSLVLVFGLSLSLIGFSYNPTVSIFSTIAFLMYLLIWLKPELFKSNERYRMVGDAVFLIPIVTFIGQ